MRWEENRASPEKTPLTNGKAERVIQTILEQLSEKTEFQWSVHRKNGPKKVRGLVYDWVKVHKGMGNLTPGEKLLEYFYPERLQKTLQILADNVL